MADRPLRPATRRCLGRPLPHQQADRPRAHPEAESISSPDHAIRRGHPVLARVSSGYPGLRGRLLTCYAPVRRSPQGKPWFSLDLHVLGAPPAFVLSQDQTLHQDLGFARNAAGSPRSESCRRRSLDLVGQLVCRPTERVGDDTELTCGSLSTESTTGDQRPHWLLAFTALFSRSDSPTAARSGVSKTTHVLTTAGQRRSRARRARGLAASGERTLVSTGSRRSGPARTGAIRRAGRGARLPSARRGESNSVPVSCQRIRAQLALPDLDHPAVELGLGELAVLAGRLAVELDRALLDQPAPPPAPTARARPPTSSFDSVRGPAPADRHLGHVVGRGVGLEHPVELGLGRLAGARRRGRGRRPCGPAGAWPRSGAARRAPAAPSRRRPARAARRSRTGSTSGISASGIDMSLPNCSPAARRSRRSSRATSTSSARRRGRRAAAW